MRSRRWCNKCGPLGHIRGIPMSTNAVRYGLIVVCIISALGGIVAYEYVALGFDRPVAMTEEEFERRLARDLAYLEWKQGLEDSLQNLWAQRYPRSQRAFVGARPGPLVPPPGDIAWGKRLMELIDREGLIELIDREGRGEGSK
jgi:hypothetical protein